jgi:beta-N-acetylhexosaminidase
MPKTPERSPQRITRVSTRRQRGLTGTQRLQVGLLLLVVLLIAGVLLAAAFQPPPAQRPVLEAARPAATSSLLPMIHPTVMSVAPAPASTTAAPSTAAPTDQIRLPASTWQKSPAPSEGELQAFIAGMSLPDKVAQLVLCGFDGQSLASSPALQMLVGTYHIGGVIFLEPNAHDPQQISRLTTELQALAASTGAHIPLFISSNHEGGVVVRITDGVTGFPGNMAVGATERLEYAYVAAALSAQELRSMGINMNLAPVLDVNDNPLNPVIGVRSFGDNPALVAEYGRLAVRGTQDNGVIAVAKHFPGHGSVALDSHGSLPIIDETLDELQQHGLKPFAAAIQEGVAAIMVAHIALPALDDSGRPATLSPEIVTSLLRQQMKFDGLIMTDSLGMGAVTQGRGQPEAAVEAVQAGADMVISTGPFNDQIGIIEALVAAVRNGSISMAQIDQSVRRVLLLKHQYGLFETAEPHDLTSVGSSDHQATADKIAGLAVTLLRDDTRLIPLPASLKRLLLVSPDHLPPASTGTETLFAELLRQQGYEVTEVIYDLDSAASRNAAWSQAMAQAAAHDLVVFGEWELIKRYINDDDQWQEQFVGELARNSTPVIVVAWHNPAAIMRVPSASTFITAYGNTRAQVKAIAEALAGSVAPLGQLPMNIQNLP